MNLKEFEQLDSGDIVLVEELIAGTYIPGVYIVIGKESNLESNLPAIIVDRQCYSNIDGYRRLHYNDQGSSVKAYAYYRLTKLSGNPGTK
jgi:hypothetical protein